MTDVYQAERTILKVLTGLQAGVEVSLTPGVYVIGSGPEDDIQLLDVSLLAGHAKLRLSGARIQISGGAGSLKTNHGLIIEPEGDWQDLEPLEIVTIGTTRLALGPPTAKWDSVLAMETEESAPPSPPPVSSPSFSFMSFVPSWEFVKDRWQVFSLGAAAVFFVFLLGLYVISSLQSSKTIQAGDTRTDFEIARAALDQFPFGRDIQLKQEADGSLYAVGYVETLAERRAILASLEKINTLVYPRLWVRTAIRNELDNLIKSRGMKVTYTLSPQGELTLEGLVLDPTIAKSFIDLIRDNVLGLAQIESHIKTSVTLLQDIEKLARLSQISGLVLFHVNGNLVEATGAVPVDKVDAWVGFLQAYSQRFAKDISLRSFVQLQSEQIKVMGRDAPSNPDQAVIIGSEAQGPKDVALDLDRLLRGVYELGDVFSGFQKDSSGSSIAGRTGRMSSSSSPSSTKSDGETAKSSEEAAKTTNTPDLQTIQQTLSDLAQKGSGQDKSSVNAKESASSPSSPSSPSSSSSSSSLNSGTESREEDATNKEDSEAAAIKAKEEEEKKEAQARAASSSTTQQKSSSLALKSLRNKGPEDTNNLLSTARALLQMWNDRQLNKEDKESVSQRLAQALDLLEQNQKDMVSGEVSGEGAKGLVRLYLPLFRDPRQDKRPESPCWPGAHIARNALPATLFWLDILSTGNVMSLTSFGRGEQELILEAALNPTRVVACMEADPSSAALAKRSLYLAEVQKNPNFIRFITRDLKVMDLSVAGIRLGEDSFLQSRIGQKLREGYAPDEGSRITAIGELGASILTNTGVAVALYGPDINWMMSSTQAPPHKP